MIKEILILMLFYQHSYGTTFQSFSNKTGKGQDEVSSGGILKKVDEFSLACQQILEGDFIADGNICIPGVFKDLMQWWPSNRTDKRPEIWISISNFQVIEIGSQKLTLSMYMDISWFDNRPILKSTLEGAKKIFLSMEDKKKIWSPNIIIPFNMVSKTVEDEEFGLTNMNYSATELIEKNTYNFSITKYIQKYGDYLDASDFINKNGIMEDVQNGARKNFYISTTIKCNMNFQYFPFDEHICNLEVSKISTYPMYLNTNSNC